MSDPPEGSLAPSDQAVPLRGCGEAQPRSVKHATNVYGVRALSLRGQGQTRPAGASNTNTSRPGQEASASTADESALEALVEMEESVIAPVDIKKDEIELAETEENMQKLRIDDDGFYTIRNRTRHCLEDINGEKGVQRMPNKERLSFHDAIGAGAPPPDAPFVRGYVSMAFSDGLLITLEDDLESRTIRTMQRTTIVGTNATLQLHTIKLSAAVKIFGVTRATQQKKPNETRLMEQCEWIALTIQFPTPSDPSHVMEFEKDVIGITTRFTNRSCTIVVTQDIGRGFPIFAPMFPGGNKNRSHQEAIMYSVTQYRIQPFFNLEEMEDGMMAVYDEDARRHHAMTPDSRIPMGKMALQNLTAISDAERELIRHRGTDRNGRMVNTNKLVKSVLAADAALRVLTDTRATMDRTLFDIVPIVREVSGSFQCTVEVNSSWTTTDNHQDPAWTVGGTLLAKFQGTSESSSTSIVMTVQAVEPIEESDMSRVTLAFAPIQRPLLLAVARIPTKISIGPSDKIDLSAWNSIRNGFRQFAASRMFPQYAAGILPETSTRRTTASSNPTEIQLDDSQVALVDAITTTKGMCVGVAPPGTGKTTAIGVATRMILKSKEAKLVIVASVTNIPVGGALSAIGSSDNIRRTRVMSKPAFQQATAEERALSSVRQARDFERWIRSGTDSAELVRVRKEIEEIGQQIDASIDPAEITDLIQKMEEAEKEMSKTFITTYQPNVVGMTIALLLRYCGLAELKEATHLIIDEASQLPAYQLLAVMCALPNLKKVVLIGDPSQLPPYCPFDHNSDIGKTMAWSDLSRLVKLNPRRVCILNNIYRCHRRITENIIRPVYPTPVFSPLRYTDRDGATVCRMPRATDGTPCVLFNVRSKQQACESDEEAWAIKEFVQKHLAANPGRLLPTDFVVLTYHRKQRSKLSLVLPPGVPVRTIDGYQGQQAKFVIVSTVKNCRSMDPLAIREAMTFVANPQRSLVAVSRSTDGLYVFGNVDQLAYTRFFEPIVVWARRNGAVQEVATGRPSGSKRGRDGNNGGRHQPKRPAFPRYQ